MKAIKRVKQYIDYKGFNNSSFEKENELSNGYIGTQLRRNADLGESILNKILENCLDINPEWLLTGNGEMLKSDNENSQKKANPEEIITLQKKIIALQEENILLKDEKEVLNQRVKELEIENIQLKAVSSKGGTAGIQQKTA